MTDGTLVLPAASQRALLAAGPSPGEWQLVAAPRWLTAALGLEHHFPRDMAALPALGPLLHAVRWMAATGMPLRDFCLDLQSADGESMIVLANAPPPNRPAEEIVVELRDITDIVRQRRRTAAIGAFHGIVGQSLPMLEVYRKIALYGPTDAPVVITGETGTGKELVARALHDRSPRQPRAFVAVNCSALTEELFESELFGHEKGSFTGALRQHKGRFLRADGGTLFLDEIGEMPLMSQAKLLRALEEGVVERVGAEREERVDVRVIAATNVALEQSVAWRRFRADLYHRLSVLRIHVPPLRERHGDIPLLVDSFLEVFNRRYNRQVRRVTPEALRLLVAYHWPGNVRELRNVLERLVIETAGDAIGANALVRWMEEREYFQPGEWNAERVYEPRAPIVPEPRAGTPAWPAATDPPRVGDVFWGGRPVLRPMLGAAPEWPAEIVELEPGRPAPAPAPPPAEVDIDAPAIHRAYREARGNLTRAAAILGVHKATLYRHMKRLGIDRDELARAAAAEGEGAP